MAHRNDRPNRPAHGVDERLARHGGLSYLEIPAADPQKSSAFYEHLLGWNVDRSDPAQPKFMDQTGHLLGRWRTGRTPSREAGLVPYIYVDSLNDTVARVAAHGGEVVRAPYAEGDVLVSTVRDPAGNIIGLWQDASR